MKRITALILLYLVPLFLLQAPQVQAADTPNKTVTVYDHGDWVEFQVTLIHTSAAEDNVYSQAIDLRGLDISSGTVQLISLSGTTGRDVNIFIEGSNSLEDTTFESYQTRTEWDDFSTNGGGLEKSYFLDRGFVKTGLLAAAIASEAYVGGGLAIIGTGLSDSVAYVETDLALRCRYIRFLSDGQSGNPATSSTMIVLMLRKVPGADQPRLVSSRKASTT